jgi:hypothetical protein
MSTTKVRFLVRAAALLTAVACAVTPVHAAQVNITFSDPDALRLQPDADSTFIVWPGYIQNISNSSWAYVWMSKGPGTNFIPHTDNSAHYHIVWDNFCFNPQTGKNGIKVGAVCQTPVPAGTPRYHASMFGYDWLATYVQASGRGRINFDLLKIRVKGTVPISLWFKDASDRWWFWNSLAPGYWNLPGATNIKEFHIAATSRNANDKYMVDDILVAPR